MAGTGHFGDGFQQRGSFGALVGGLDEPDEFAARTVARHPVLAHPL